MRKGFILTECLVAAAFMAVFLPLLAFRFGDDLRSVVELRRSHEARVFASSCLERSLALYENGENGQFSERRETPLGTFEAETAVVSDAYGLRAAVEVRWSAGSGVKIYRQERHF